MTTEQAYIGRTKYAWREVPRVEKPKRSATERISDFMEVYTNLDADAARTQASRCIQCPKPSCVEGCPLHNPIPDWMALTAEGRFAEAAQVLQDAGCMGDIYSSLCNHPCEKNCFMNNCSEAISINAVERFLHDYTLNHGGMDLTPPLPNGQRVAVVDAGPCGLACSFDLARMGYSVTVYDSHSAPGGMLAVGIPSFILQKEVVQRRISMLEKLGVRFELKKRIGTDITLGELRSQHDALFLSVCADKAKPIDIPGSQLKGVLQGLDFLVEQNPGASINLPSLDLKNKRVVVLGAGDVAMDCVRIAIRAGAKSATCVYRRDAASVPANPAEYANAIEEGAQFEYLAAPIALIGDADGRVTGVRCARTRLGAPDATGRPAPQVVSGDEFEIHADIVIASFGFLASVLPEEGGFSEIATASDGHIQVDGNSMSSLPGVFAGGTLVNPQMTALSTLRHARTAAVAINRFLTAKRNAKR